nr:MAG TPA: hypothetical protein [Caudoviricetes sp.]
MELRLNVYDEDENVVKTCIAHTVSLKFKTIRSLMKLLKIDDVEDTGTLLQIISDVWEQLTSILSKCFPDMEEDDWDNVNLNELVPVVLAMLKSSFSEILTIPKDPN